MSVRLPDHDVRSRVYQESPSLIRGNGAIFSTSFLFIFFAHGIVRPTLQRAPLWASFARSEDGQLLADRDTGVPGATRRLESLGESLRREKSATERI